LTQADIGSDPNEPYFRELHQLTAEKWLQSAIDSDDEEPETW
jgi:hypothetical protein